jgi:hypothetical protein
MESPLEDPPPPPLHKPSPVVVQRLGAAPDAQAAPGSDVQGQEAAPAAPGSDVQGQEAAPTAVQRLGAAPDAQAAPGSDVEGLPAAPGALATPAAAPVDGASPTDASAVALARSLMPTVPHPAIEYNLPVLDVQRY